jgi:predicted transcriptional regulator
MSYVPSYERYYTQGMTTMTIRIDSAIEQALVHLQGDTGATKSEVVRRAILDAADQVQRAALRAESLALREDPGDRAASQELAAEMAELNAW